MHLPLDSGITKSTLWYVGHLTGFAQCSPKLIMSRWGGGGSQRTRKAFNLVSLIINQRTYLYVPGVSPAWVLLNQSYQVSSLFHSLSRNCLNHGLLEVSTSDSMECKVSSRVGGLALLFTWTTNSSGTCENKSVLSYIRINCYSFHDSDGTIWKRTFSSFC